jgi:hypothetical protein
MATTKWNFKAGDRVRCINCIWTDGYVTFGEVYVVDHYNPNGYLIKLKGIDFYFPSYNFEPEILHPVNKPEQLEMFEKEEMSKDHINHPEHYTLGKIEVFDFIKAWDLSFAEGNVIKYVVRAPWKGRPVDDLKKARWYLDQLIKKAEDDNG